MNERQPSSVLLQRLPHLAAAGLMALVLMLTLTLSPAAAAQLILQPASLASAQIAGRCTPSVSVTHGTIVAGQSTAVIVTDLSTACVGQELDLTLYGLGGEALTSTAMPLTVDQSESATLTVAEYTPSEVAGAAVTIGSWGVPVMWTFNPPTADPLVTCSVLNDPTGTKSCEATDVRIEVWGYPQLNTYNFHATVTSPSASEDVEWQLTINLAHPDLQVLANLADSNNSVMVAPGWSCSSMPMLELRGQAHVNTQFVGGGKTVTIWMMGKAVPASTPGGSLFNCS